MLTSQSLSGSSAPKNGSSLFGADSKELCNDFKRHSFGLRDLQENKDPRDCAHDSINAKDTDQANRTKHHRQRVGDNDVSDPVNHGTDGNAEASDSCGEDL
uniref:Uncharacterized protein n=1 Tax=Salix viminalis TaxID=40686 RepID=A0A6N2LG05_SALVM